MLAIPGYQPPSKIHESTNSRVYRSRREKDGLPVILKVLKKDYPTPEEISRYKLEYEITHSLTLERVIKAYELHQYENTFAICLEDFGGESLTKLISSQAFNLSEILQLAIDIADALGHIHTTNIVHKDINPSNIVFNPLTKQVKIIDFGISSILPQEKIRLQHLQVLEGTLTYMSPEQTGRMNRSLDYRTDFYSFGATLYHLLINQPPFQAQDPLELLHCHLAMAPVPPHIVNPAIPSIVSEIVMKLLEKNAENRYQNAVGIKADLKDCLIQLENHQSIHPFVLAQQDYVNKFQIPEKLYGREKDVKVLLAAFERVAKNTSPHTPELLFVAGYSGIGKSSLVQEIYQPITQYRGYFVAGKFDQYQRNIPYFAIAQALQDLVKQLLTESEASLAQWRAALQTALGSNGQVMTELIPALTLIVGEQPEVESLPPTEAQNRFNLVFQNLMQVFAQPAHPLVIFLDDLQWADGASLKLIQRLATRSELQSLLLIGAYRDNEVHATHPLILLLEELRSVGVGMQQISLAPLALADINQLVADTLRCDLTQALPLAQLVQLKTGGNPFFMNEFLKSLYAEELVKFNATRGQWQWSIEQVSARDITDNVVELMASKLQRLNPRTCQVLQVAACIGNQFDLELLTFAIAADSPQETARILRSAIVEGLILPLSNAHKSVELNVPLADHTITIKYRFAHDRIQQAAYSLIPETERQIVHRQVGQRLRQHTPVAQQEQWIFDITNQLNLGQDLLQQQSERNELAQLNQIAGAKAKATAAYSSASQYCQTGLNLLAADCWHTHYNLTLNLYLTAAEAEYLNINFEQATELATMALTHAATLGDRARVCELQMQICMAQQEMVKAVDIGLQILAQLGIAIEPNNSQNSLLLQMPPLAELTTMAVMTDPDKLAAMRILRFLCTPVFMAKPEMFPQIILSMVNLCLEYGNSKTSPFAYGFYGLLLAGTGNIEAGYHAGHIALNLLESFQARELTAKVYNLFNSNIRTWKEHARNSIGPLQEAIRVGLEVGDIEWSGYCAANLCSYLFFAEENLELAIQRQAVYVSLCSKLQQNIPTYFTRIWHQLALNLHGLAVEPCLLVGESFDETVVLPRLIEAKSGTVLYIFYVAKTILLYHFGQYSQALQQVQLAQAQAGAAFGFMQVAVLNFYHSLTVLAPLVNVAPLEQLTVMAQVEENQRQMQIWATHAPMNYLHKWYLVEAERYRVLGQVMEAMEAYDRAIALAKEQEYPQDAALANELAARFYRERGKTTIARAYLQEAHYGYIKWGATAKVQALQREYPEWFELQTGKSTMGMGLATVGSSSSNLEAIDLATVIKASQAISNEMVLDDLLATLMRILIENAGAQTGYLLLPTQNEWRLEAIGAIGDQPVAVMQSIPLHLIENSPDACLPTAIVHYVTRTRESVVLDHAAAIGLFTADPWIVKHQAKSILCVPLISQGELSGIVYLENNLSPGAFTPNRIEMIHLLSTQSAISINKARLLKQQAELNESLRSEIAERQQAEKERDRLNAELEQRVIQRTAQLTAANKELEAFSYSVSHDLRAPVRAIDGFLRILQEDYSDQLDTEGNRYIKIVRDNAKRMGELIDDLLALSRLNRQEMHRQPIYPNDLIQRLLNDMELEMRDREIQFELADLPICSADLSLLKQVWVNLLSNAIKYTRNQVPARITIDANEIEGEVVYFIQDNGAGFDMRYANNLFGVFQRLHRDEEFEGTGIGLAIVQRIIHRHGGRIWAEAAVNQGATFYFTFPDHPPTDSNS